MGKNCSLCSSARLFNKFDGLQVSVHNKKLHKL